MTSTVLMGLVRWRCCSSEERPLLIVWLCAVNRASLDLSRWHSGYRSIKLYEKLFPVSQLPFINGMTELALIHGCCLAALGELGKWKSGKV
jgi:hypothetical protein